MDKYLFNPIWRSLGRRTLAFVVAATGAVMFFFLPAQAQTQYPPQSVPTESTQPPVTTISGSTSTTRSQVESGEFDADRNNRANRNTGANGDDGAARGNGAVGGNGADRSRSGAGSGLARTGTQFALATVISVGLIAIGSVLAMQARRRQDASS